MGLNLDEPNIHSEMWEAGIATRGLQMLQSPVTTIPTQ